MARVSATIRRDQACSRSEAGKRPISLPEGLRGDIEIHLSRYAQAGPTGRLFVGPQGGIPRRRNFNRIWHAALKAAGIPRETDLHPHDLRHTGSTWSAQSGATLKELMARIGPRVRGQRWSINMRAVPEMTPSRRLSTR
jgi:integrase